MKKILIVIICTIFLTFTTAIVPYNEQKAEAATFAIAGMAVSATAVYILTTLAVASLATAVGIEYGDEINQHAKDVWAGASSSIKNSFADALSLSTDGYFNLTGSLKTWFNTAVNSITSKVMTTRNAAISAGESFTPSTTTQMIEPNATFNPNSIVFEKVYEIPSGHVLMVSTPSGIVIYDKLRVNITKIGNMTIQEGTGGVGMVGVLIYGQIGTQTSTYNLPNSHGGEYSNAFLSTIRGATTIHQVLNLFNQVGMSHVALMSQQAIDNYYGSIVTNAGVIFGSGTLGLNLPSDDLYLPKAVNGQTLTRNPDGTYSYPNGNVYSGEVVYELPNTTILDIDGVRVPVIPMLDYPGYYVDVKTGQIITTLEVEGDVPLPFPGGVVVPPDQLPAEMKPDKATKKLNLLPLQMVGEKLKSKFPFSIPFDFIKQIAVFDVTAKTPVISIDKPNFVNIGGRSIPLKFNIDFTMFDGLAAATRWALLIAFDIGLILMIRRLMPE